MENISVQKSFGWCNVHCLINIFGEKKFKQFLNNQKYKGCGIKDVNEMISIVYKDRGISVVCEINECYGSLPNSLVWNIINNCKHKVLGLAEPDMDFTPIAPYILSIDKGIKNSRHAIAVMNCNGVIVISDPYWKKMKIIKSEQELFSLINSVTVIERPTILNTDSWLLLNAECSDYASEALNHINPLI